MKRSIKSIILSSLMCLNVLTGCGAAVSSNNINQTGIEFSWWGNDDRHKYTMDGVNIFQDSNKDITVHCRYGEWSGYERRNRVWHESQTEADVMQINYGWLTEYSLDGEGYYNLYELTDYIDLSSFDKSDLEYGVMNGKLNAIPIAFNTSTVCYNKTLFSKYNINCPKTWDDLFKVAEVLSKDGIYTIGASKKHVLLMLIAYFEQTTGKNVFDKEGNVLIDKEDWAYILDFYKELIDKNVLMPIDQFDMNKLTDGEVAMGLFWISDADNYCKAMSDSGNEPVITDYFTSENAKLTGIYMKPATMYAISKTTENPKEAARLLNYLLNSEEMAKLQGTEKGVPVSSIAVETLKNEGMLEGYGYKAYENMQKNKNKLNVMIPIMESDAVMDAFKANADAYIYDVATREETIDKIYEDIKALTE